MANPQQDIIIAERRPVLTERGLEREHVAITPLPPAARLSLRARPGAVAALSKTLGLTLPQAPRGMAVEGARSAIWLGPDEWLVIDTDGVDLAATLTGTAGLYSAVDISHRNCAIAVEGRAAEAVISAGCPLDLDLTAFPAGSGTRTLFGKAEIVLIRESEPRFRVEVWRSFADYVFGLLEQAAADEAG